MAVQKIPEGYQSVIPYLVVKDVAGVIAFLKRAFDASERHKMAMPDGRVMHAEVQLGNCRLMLGEAPDPSREMPAMFYMYVDDVDAQYKKALAAGGTSVREPTNEFYGDRSAGVKDASGNQWWVATHVEDVSDKELLERAATHKH